MPTKKLPVALETTVLARKKGIHPADPEEAGSTVLFYKKGIRPAWEVGHSFSFVLNISRLLSRAPSVVAPGHELRRATKREVVAIKDVLTNFTASAHSPAPWPAWQYGERVKEKTGTARYPLPEDQWRYFVIAFKGSNSTTVEIERALCIAPLELKIGFTLLHKMLTLDGPVLICNPGRLFVQLQAAEREQLSFLDLSSGVVENIGLLREQIRSCDENLVNVKRITGQMLELDALPYGSQLFFLGYFAILESLLTHQPRKTDTIDSITRQVKQKVMLLDNRWHPRIDYSPFQGSKPEAIWSAMYAYRSSLAHGGEPDFVIIH